VDKWFVLGYSLIAWIVVIGFALLPKKLPITDNLFVYFCSSIVVISAFTILGYNVNRFEYSERLDFFFCREFGRYLIYPFLLLLFTNVFFLARNTLLRWGTTLFTYVALCIVHYSYHLIGDIKFVEWNLFYSMLLFAGLMATAWLFELTFAHLIRKERVQSP
jgi:hypothetical protein